jgi:hypothetical protein
MCNCEHEDCRHPYMGVTADDRSAVWIGPVCDECAETCVADFLVPVGTGGR